MSEKRLDAAIGRIDSRVEQRRQEIRAALAGTEVEPLLDSLKATFGARLLYLRVGDREFGEDIPPGIIVRGDWQPARNRFGYVTTRKRR